MAHSALAVAQYILQRKPALTPMQIIKLVYICHGWMLGLRKRPLINETVQAWAYGPVIRTVYDAVKEYGSNPVSDISAPEEVFLPDEEKIINWVVDFYGKFSGVRLSKMTHMPGTPWEVTWNSQGKNSLISNDLIQDFYERQAAIRNVAVAS